MNSELVVVTLHPLCSISPSLSLWSGNHRPAFANCLAYLVSVVVQVLVVQVLVVMPLRNITLDCPVYVRSYVAHKVWEAMRQPALTACDGGSDGVADDDDSDDDDVLDTPVNSTYESMKLIKEVTTKANDIILEMTRTFTRERVAKTPHYLPVSSFAIKNTRRKMEDRHICLRDLNTLYDMEYGEPHAFYGVFDGHAGSDAAVYTAAHLHQYLIQNPLYHMDPVAALKHAFHFADTNFLKKAKKEVCSTCTNYPNGLNFLKT
ncbi:PPM-type phosphatase domain [Trinorchestia longiramus]|nr:PPM-type phosphatase domain [Trinorchestia longiramus]